MFCLTTESAERRRYLENEALDAIFEDLLAIVDKEPDLAACDFHISQKLCLVNGKKFFHMFVFYDYLSFHPNVQPKILAHFLTLVGQRDVVLAFDTMATGLQFPAKAFS